MISFSLHQVTGNQWIGLIDVFVMNADGSSLRPLKGDISWMLAWSPDGSMIAAQRGRIDREGAVIVVINVSSGVVRVLEATSVETKVEGDWSLESGGSSSTGRKWDYESLHERTSGAYLRADPDDMRILEGDPERACRAPRPSFEGVEGDREHLTSDR